MVIDTPIKKGYKQTEVGVIPNDWSLSKIDDLATKIGSGITPTGGETVYKEYGRPLVRSQNIGWGRLLLDDIVFIDDETHQTFQNTEIKLNDIFLNISGASIGRSSFANEKLVGGNVNQHVCIIRTIERLLNPVFLNIFLLSKNGQNQIDSFQSGGNRQGLNIGQIKTFLVPLPPTKEEQTAIATVLSDTDALIEHLEKLIFKKKAIKQGAMQQLLTGKKRLPGFSGKWEVKELGKVLRIKHGKSQKGIINVNGKYPILATGGEIGRTDQYLYDNPSVLIGRKGTIDIPQYMETPFWTIDTLFYTEIELDNDPKFIFYKFQLIDWYSHNEASGVPSLNAMNIEKIQLSFPLKKSEQTAIATVLSDMDAEIEKLESQLIKYKNIKQGMMQQLLTGKIRIYATN